MWAWTRNGSLARSPMVFTRRLTASAVNGPPRSVSKTKAPVVLRCSSRSMRNSSPRIGWTAAPFNLRPFEIGDLNGPQAVPEGNQDQRSVPVAVAPQLGGGDQLLDLGRGQVFAGTHLGIRPSCRYFPINVVWPNQPQVRHHQHFPLHPDSNLPDNGHSSESRTGCKCRVSQPVAAGEGGHEGSMNNVRFTPMPKTDIRHCSKERRYSITSSARAISEGGTVRPSAFAVLRLMVSSYLVGACTGRSAGFSPLRMRST